MIKICMALLENSLMFLDYDPKVNLILLTKYTLNLHNIAYYIMQKGNKIRYFPLIKNLWDA